MVKSLSTSPIDDTLRRVLARTRISGPLEPGLGRLADVVSVEANPQRILHVGGSDRAAADLCRALPSAVVHGVDDLVPDDVRHLEFDTLIAPYHLSKCNPGYEEVLDRMWEVLPPGGTIGILDYHDAASDRFASYMGHVHHVRMAGHLVPALRERFLPLHVGLFVPFMGIWRICTFVGRKV